MWFGKFLRTGAIAAVVLAGLQLDAAADPISYEGQLEDGVTQYGALPPGELASCASTGCADAPAAPPLNTPAPEAARAPTAPNEFFRKFLRCILPSPVAAISFVVSATVSRCIISLSGSDWPL